jgi:hypothetical protein
MTYDIHAIPAPSLCCPPPVRWSQPPAAAPSADSLCWGCQAWIEVSVLVYSVLVYSVLVYSVLVYSVLVYSVLVY